MTDLARFEAAERTLAEIATVSDALDLIGAAEAARVLAERMRLGTASVNHATIIKLRAERRLAEMVDAGQAAGTIATHATARQASSPDSGLETLPDLGVSKQRLAEARQIRDAYTDADLVKLAEENRDRELRRDALLRAARERDAAAKRSAPMPPLDLPGCRVEVGDFREVLADLEPGSVDAIITDPPYPREFVPLYGAMSELAAKVLRPDGVLAAMTGQLHLPDYLEQLGRHMRYRWCGAYVATGKHTRVFPARVASAWKPILVYQHPEAMTTPWFLDYFTSDRDDKAHHHWGQSESGMASLVERLTEPGQLVVDPFLGGGTTAVVCRDLGRRFIGCDVDPAAVATARERLA